MPTRSFSLRDWFSSTPLIHTGAGALAQARARFASLPLFSPLSQKLSYKCVYGPESLATCLGKFVFPESAV
jgi:hypothetical protein